MVDSYLKLVKQLEDMVLANVSQIGSGPIFQVPDAATLDAFTP